MSKTKKFFKGLGVISVPALCVYAIVGAVVVPLLIFETGASKEYNDTAKKRSEGHWMDNFAEKQASGTDKGDILENHFTFVEHKNAFTVDGRKSSIYELAKPDVDPDKDPDVVNESSEKLMIFSHGLNSTHWNVMESAFYWAALGYRVISWDQRGGGDNRDSHITFGYSEAEDLNNLYKAVIGTSTESGLTPVKDEFKDIKSIVMYGQSNGAATTISFADRFQDSLSKTISTKFIEESGYTSPKRQFQTALNLHGIMPAAVVPLTIPMYELYADRNLSDEDADYLAQSGNIGQPLFIVHGDEDPIVDFQMGVDLYEKMKGNVGTGDGKNAQPSIYIGKGLNHIGVSRDSDINKDPDQVTAVEKFFKDLGKITGSATDGTIPASDQAKIDAAISQLKTTYKVTIPKGATGKLAGYPNAVRFFYYEFLWDQFGVATEEAGDHVK